MRLRSLVEKSRPLIAALEEIAVAHHASAPQVALNWLIHFHGDTVVTIPGASHVHHAEQSAGAMGFTLTEHEMAEIDELSRSFK
jgi:aryl-alcohol dehydrogenase-like predicted oxidoreductase